MPLQQTPSPSESDATLRYVRWVEKLFRIKAKVPVTIAGATTCAGCSVRTLQLTFFRCRGMTPMAALTRADRATSISVIRAAYGFTNPGRCARLFSAV